MIIKLPSNTVQSFANQSVDAKKLLSEYVLLLPYWKQNDGKIVSAAIELDEALSASDGSVLELSTETRNKTLEAMSTGQGVTDPVLNRLYLRILRSFHHAE